MAKQPMNFETDNKKFQSKETRTNIFNPQFNPTVSALGGAEKNVFMKNIDKWTNVVSYYKWSPDLWFDLITPETGGIRLDLDQRVMLRSMARFLSVYGVFPRGYGKCQSGDTLLFTKDGIKELGSYFNYQDNDKETFIKSDISVLNRYGEIESTNAGVYSGLKNTKIITTEEGYETESSLNHPLLVINSDGILDWKRSEDIVVGDYIPISRKNDIWGTNTKLNIDMDTYLDTFSNSGRWKIDRVKCNIVDELDEDLALIIGYLLGDGCLTRDNVILFSNKDEDILKNYIDYFENILGMNVIKKKGDNVDYLVNGMYVREYFRQIGLEQCNAFTKYIPECIMTAPKNIVAKVIQGLFDTDGGISNSYIEYCTASKKMSKQIQTILLNFGIVSSRSKKYNKKYQTNSYRITIYSKNMNTYLEEIGFSCIRKQDKLKELCDKKRNPNKDIIPYQKQLINKFYKDIKKYNSYVYDEVYHVLKENNELTYEKLIYLLSLNNSELCDGYLELKELFDLKYFYSKVKSIEDGINNVYDLSLPDTHSFVANGMISHNTMIEVMALYHTAVFFPDIELSMTAQTRENASKLLEEKHREILKFYPLIGNEIIKAGFSKDSAEIKFTSGSYISILANHQSSKGARRKRLVIEESALLDADLFVDVLEPVVNVPRRTIGKLAVINPEEMNGALYFFTTSGFRGSSEYERNITMIDEMAELKGKIVLGADWELACHYGRGETRSQLLDKKDKLSPVFFGMNYGSKWCGASDNQLVDINRLMSIRTSSKSELKGDGKSEYILGIDVARSEDTSNNQSSISVVKIKRASGGRISNVSLVNIINVSNALNFTAQAVAVKKIKKLYNAKMLVLDTNGLGVGLLDKLLEETIDPNTGENLGCYGTINTDQIPEMLEYDKCVYDLKPQSANSEVIITFIDMVEGNKLTLLEKRAFNDYDVTSDDLTAQRLPFINTDFLIEEVANLKLKQLSNGKYSIEKVIKKYNKDRFSSLAYALWYIAKFEDMVYEEMESDILDYMIM